MKKLMSLLVAAVFAVSSGVTVAASHAGAPMKKDEMKKDGMKKDGMKKGDKKAEKKMTFSRKNIRVGIERILNDAARSCSSSVFTFPNTMSACFSELASNTGAKPLHGPHQGAQKSTRTMSLPFTTCSKLSLVNAIVAMRRSPEFVGAAIITGALGPSAQRPQKIRDRAPVFGFTGDAVVIRVRNLMPRFRTAPGFEQSARVRGRDDPVSSRNEAQQWRLDPGCKRDRVEAMPEHERHRQKRIVALCHFDDAVVRRHEYDSPQRAMGREVNSDPAAQTAPHRDDAFGIHLGTSLCVIVDHEPVLKELLFSRFAFAFPVAAKVHEQQRPAGEMVRGVHKPGNFLRVAAEVDDEGRGGSVALYQPAPELDTIGGDDAHLFDVRTRCGAGFERTREEQHPLLEKPHEQRHADGDAEHDLQDRTDHQCNLTLGSVPRLRMRARVSSATPTGPWSAYRCILYSDRYISRANQPSTR